MAAPSFDYQRDGFAVGDAVVQTHRMSWDAIAAPGSQWSGEERVEIARQARATRARRADPAWLREGLPDAEGRLSDTGVEVTRTIAADAHRIDAAWAAKQIAALGEAAYVELGSVVVAVTAIDAFQEALGRPHEPLPTPAPGAPTGEVLEDAREAGAYVRMQDPFQGPNVARALSLVPVANRLFFANVMAMYGGPGGGFYDMTWTGPFSRPQAELLAARVSAVNECFY